MANQYITIVNDSNFESEVLKSDKPVLIDFWAEWCGPCRALAPTIDELAVEDAGRVKIAKMNVDENPMTPGQFRIRGIPTMLIFKNGQLVDQLVGAHPKSTITQVLNKYA